jgi:uncharacterized membrane protein
MAAPATRRSLLQRAVPSAGLGLAVMAVSAVVAPAAQAAPESARFATRHRALGPHRLGSPAPPPRRPPSRRR